MFISLVKDRAFPLASFGLVRLVVGVFLLASAGLKIYGLAFDPFGDDSLLGSPQLLIAAIELEIILGLWLLSGWAPCTSCLAAVGFFGVLAAVSLYLALDGRPSCGCFGAVTVSPWLTFALDTVIIAFLFAFRPARTRQSLQPTLFQSYLSTSLGAAAFLALIAGAFLISVDNPNCRAGSTARRVGRRGTSLGLGRGRRTRRATHRYRQTDQSWRHARSNRGRDCGLLVRHHE